MNSVKQGMQSVFSLMIQIIELYRSLFLSASAAALVSASKSYEIDFFKYINRTRMKLYILI